MGLDICVMRPRRFFQRDFLTPVQRAFGDTVPVQVLGVTPMSAADADLMEGNLVRAVRQRQQDPRYVLPNDNEIYYSEQLGYAAFNLLREFAAHFDYPVKAYLFWGDRAFGQGYRVEQYPSIKAAWRRKKTRYAHLVFHLDTQGSYFPTALPQPIATDFGYIGSTQLLQQELLALRLHLHRAFSHQEIIAEAIDNLLGAADASLKSGLPIIFDG